MRPIISQWYFKLNGSYVRVRSSFRIFFKYNVEIILSRMEEAVHCKLIRHINVTRRLHDLLLSNLISKGDMLGQCAPSHSVVHFNLHES